MISCALEATEAAGVWRNAIGPRLPSLLSQAGLRVSGCKGTCFVSERADPARLAFASQSLELVAGNAVAAGSITAAERDAALALFAAVAHLP